MDIIWHNVYFEWLARSIGIVVILFITFISVRIIKTKALNSAALKRGDETRIKFFVHFFVGIIYFLGVIFALYLIPTFRSLATSLFAGSGVLALIVGFASQHAFANIVSGIFIALFKPFRIGDRIKLVGKDIVGMVEDITLRHTVVRTFENKRTVIPNSVISTDIIENANLIEEKTCKFLEIGISYDSDIDKAILIMKDAVANHADFYDNRTDEEKEKNEEPVTVRVLGFGESSVTLRAWVWGKDAPTVFKMVCELNKTIKERFDKESIEIPFPYRTLVFKDKNFLRPAVTKNTPE